MHPPQSNCIVVINTLDLSTLYTWSSTMGLVWGTPLLVRWLAYLVKMRIITWTGWWWNICHPKILRKLTNDKICNYHHNNGALSVHLPGLSPAWFWWFSIFKTAKIHNKNRKEDIIITPSEAKYISTHKKEKDRWINLVRWYDTYPRSNTTFWAATTDLMEKVSKDLWVMSLR